MFFSDSRYRPIGDYTVPAPGGREVKVKRLRINAKAEGSFRYTVKEGDRIDLLAWRFYRNPRKWWLIADANPAVLDPGDLLAPGRVLIIPPNRDR